MATFLCKSEETILVFAGEFDPNDNPGFAPEGTEIWADWHFQVDVETVLKSLFDFLHSHDNLALNVPNSGRNLCIRFLVKDDNKVGNKGGLSVAISGISVDRIVYKSKIPLYIQLHATLIEAGTNIPMKLSSEAVLIKRSIDNFAKCVFMDDSHGPNFSHGSRFKAELSVEVFGHETEIFGIQLPSAQQMNRRMLQEEILTDFSIRVEKDTILKCHKFILISRSNVFEKMFGSSRTPTKVKDVLPLDISKAAATALLKYLYYFDLDGPLKNCKIALELLQTGHAFNIELLEKAVSVIFMKKDYSWYELEVATSLFLWTLKVDEKEDLWHKSARFLRIWKEAMKTDFIPKLLYKHPTFLEDLSDAFFSNTNQTG